MYSFLQGNFLNFKLARTGSSDIDAAKHYGNISHQYLFFFSKQFR